ncbi:VTT domain-containing protein [Geomonas subterranea]|uniref:VTT domain-containing protein n=1 Tax=Geomonas subterranea TaxID=2847989 RepID=A0ABX8LJ81_9BACT|nr:VTT domain-containing protein [Geomonas subterranea]QXE90946.1 VTT domain-containing protein [Geomonas subterranea]QXM10967.1 VTT domain-containing protein [Geomonas subterranea]
MTANESVLRPALRAKLAATKAGCTDCGACLHDCAFLKRFGTPGGIARSCDPSDRSSLCRSFECSLCGLCSQLCPERLDLDGMFLEMRREAVERGVGEFQEHAPLIGYERAGTSRRFSLYLLPEGCSTIFFPGCSLSGTRPDALKMILAALRESDQGVGIVFDCCLKPSHSLGRERYVSAMFDEMNAWLTGQGVTEVLVACPNCQTMFQTLGKGLKVRTVWERLAESGMRLAPVSGTVTVHDPCVLRGATSVHGAVRDLLRRQGMTVEEMPHSGEKTLCCGKGGAVDLLNPDLAGSWGELRKQEAAGRRTVTYCAGCVQALGAHTPTWHVADLLFSPGQAMAGKKMGASGLFTYVNRLRLKRSLRRMPWGAVTRERDSHAGERRKRVWLPFVILTLLVAALAAVQLSGASHYIQQDRLRGLIASYGTLAPAVYILVYALAPVLFLPALPLTIAGGIVFGPFWGVVYTIVGATMGASLAFLVARYAARDWVASKLTGPRWQRLDSEVAQHGWKVVAFTRLIPAFPFNLLNYAFGLTRINFAHYMLTSFVCMLPATVAFIVFSSSLPDLLRGRLSPATLAGIALISVVMLIPVCYRRRPKRGGGAAATQ